MCPAECAELPATDAVEIAGKLFYLVHSVADLDINPEVAGVSVVVSGHSHRAGVAASRRGAVSESRAAWGRGGSSFL